jgi:hypothetical protein
MGAAMSRKRTGKVRFMKMGPWQLAVGALWVGALGLAAACGGKAVIDAEEEEPLPRECFDPKSCCEAALALMDERCPSSDGEPRVCAIDTLPDMCVPFIGDVYRCIVDNPDAITCDGDIPRLACGTCTEELEAAGEPCGQTQTCAP